MRTQHGAQGSHGIKTQSNFLTTSWCKCWPAGINTELCPPAYKVLHKPRAFLESAQALPAIADSHVTSTYWFEQNRLFYRSILPYTSGLNEAEIMLTLFCPSAAWTELIPPSDLLPGSPVCPSYLGTPIKRSLFLISMSQNLRKTFLQW